MLVVHRYPFAVAVAAFAGLVAAPVLAQAPQKYPNKPVRLVISSTAGSQPDGIARIIALKMSEAWGQPVVVDNRAGGGGMLAATAVAKATPDGYTVLYALPNFVITPALQANVTYDPFKDFAGAGQIGISTNVLVASPALGAKSVQDLIALAKAQPGKLICASSATGSASHLTSVRFNLIAGIKVVHVAFRGGPEATIEVLAGRSHYHVGTMGVTLPFVKEGKLVALGVTSPQRAPVLPDVPALGEIMAEFKRPETSHALLLPAGTPRPIVNQISKELARVLALPDVRERLQNISYVVAPSTPEEYNKILREQFEALTKVVRDGGLKAK